MKVPENTLKLALVSDFQKKQTAQYNQEACFVHNTRGIYLLGSSSSMAFSYEVQATRLYMIVHPIVLLKCLVYRYI